MKHTHSHLSPASITFPERSGHVAPSVWAACLGIFAAYLPITLVSASLTPIGHGLSASISDLQWVQDAFVVAMAAIIFPAGTLGDLLGRKKVYLVALGLLALGNLVVLGARTVNVLWFGQAITGLGAGALLPSTLAILSAAVPDPRRRAPLIGAWASSLGLGLSLGPFIAGVLLQEGEWHWIFLPLIPFAVLVLLWAARFLPESFAREGRTLDLLGQLTVVLGTVALIFGVIEGPDHGWGSLLVVSSFVLAVLSFIAFVLIEQGGPSPLLRLDLFRSPAFTATSLIAVLAMFALIGTNFVLSLFFGLVQYLTPLDIACRFLILNGLAALIGPVVGRIQHRVGARWLLTLGLLLAGGSLLSMAGVDAHTTLVGVGWRLALLAIGFGLVLTPMTAAAVEAVPRPLAGMASAANNAFRQTGAALGPAVLGAIVASRAVQVLPDLLVEGHLPASVRSHVLAVANAHGVSVVGVVPFGPYTDQVHRAASLALTASMQTAIVVAGLTLLLASLVTLVLLRPSKALPTNQQVSESEERVREKGYV